MISSTLMPDGSLRKRRLQRACDTCRKKKARCNGDDVPGSRCATCITFGVECRYDGPSERRPSAKKRQVEALEARLESLEGTVRELRSVPSESSSAPSPEIVSPPRQDTETVTEKDSDREKAINDTADVNETLSEWMKNLELDPLHRRPMHLGQPSSNKLLWNVYQMKQKLSGGKAVDLKRRPEFWLTDPREGETFAQHQQAHAHRQYVFPPTDLVPALINSYFTNCNVYFPVLHRPSFMKLVSDDLHLRDKGFAAVYILVCALGSKFTNDPRVFSKVGNSTKHHAGWAWFEQLRIGNWPILAVPRLHDVQAHVLAIMYTAGFSLNGMWYLVSHALKMAIDAGVHRKRVYSRPITAEEEMWKRAFWVLLTYDRLISPGTGRPYTLQEEDFDVEWPMDCDDEYWDDGFRQPEGKPSKIRYFLMVLKLQQIHSFSLRMLSGVKASRSLLGLRDSSTEEQLIVEIDSALKKWLSSLPDHLRWDPQREDPLFFHQSALLHIQYNHLQIIIHRPYIARNQSAPSMCSLDICIAAARSNSHLFDAVVRRIEGPHMEFYSAFSSAIVLVLNLWNRVNSNTEKMPSTDFDDIVKCMRYLKAAEKRNTLPGQVLDMLIALMPPGTWSLEDESVLDRDSFQRQAPSSSKTSSHELPPAQTQELTQGLGTMPSQPVAPITWTEGPILEFGDGATAHLSTHGSVPMWPSEITFGQMLDTFSRRTPPNLNQLDVGQGDLALAQSNIHDPMTIWANTTSAFEIQDQWASYFNGVAGQDWPIVENQFSDHNIRFM